MPATRQNLPIEKIPFEIGATARHRLGMPPARFLRDYWQKRPLLIRNAFPGFQAPLSPDDLAGLACMDGALARIVLHQQRAKALDSGFRAAHGPGPEPFPRRALRRNDGKWKVLTGPFDDATFATLPKSNWTLLVQDVDKWDADTAALLCEFAFIPGWRIDDVMISYATDAGGVGAHVDQYDVFLLQGRGQRRWSIDARANPSTTFCDDVELKLLREFHPTHTWTLDPGDLLYLPPGVPHDGVAVGECMTFSIGMRAPAAAELLFDLAAHVAESLPESRRFADPDLKPAGDAGEIDDAALRRARRAIGPVSAALDDDAFADWFGRFITRYRVAQAPVPRKRGMARAVLAERLPQVTFERDPWSRFAWCRRGRDARLYAAGSAFDAPRGWARELASGARTFDGARLAGLPQRARGIALLASLIDAGHLRLRRR
ncbi:MAG: cupin domain-containing protein [Xanthomonadaceae bacterium]|nr:cupin domain-containing protein [Xanthomonadaceae bacterium]